MNRIPAVLFTLSVVLMTTTGSATTPQSVEVTRNLTSMPLAFTENRGQWDEQVSFRANAGGATMWFTKDGAVYQFTRTIPVGQDPRGPDGRQDGKHPDLQDSVIPAQAGIHSSEPDSIESIAIKASFVGANPNPQMVGADMMEYKCNYFIGNDPNEWHTDVPNYNAIVYEEIYSGIDLKYYGNGKQMEYDFIVEPGADYSQIEIQYEGAESISINDNGELVVEAKWGEVVEQRPVIYQIDNSSRIAVTGEYSLKGESSFGFELNNYDPALPLVIDPVLSYSTYLGGSSDYDQGNSIAVDTSGAAYVTGYTYSTDFPTLNPYQGTLQGNSDVFVTKLSSSGNSLIYSTYLGGSFYDYGNGIAVDASGAAYVTGSTESTDYPTFNPYQGTYQGDIDVFVTKLSISGNSLIYSTYLGGSFWDDGNGISVDASGAVYVTGFTESTDFPTLNPYQGTLQGGSVDAFVTKLSSTGNSLIYSTYLGGDGYDHGKGIAVDASGMAYVTGLTFSTDFPTFNPYQGIYQGDRDAFVTKISSSGNSLVYSTYLGGDGYDFGYGIAVDAFWGAYVTGETNSTDFPTLNPFQGTNHGGQDAFVTKLINSGDSLIYSTYLGGNYNDYGRDIAVDASGAAYVTGNTNSTDFPTLNPYQGTLQGGSVDAFVTKLSEPIVSCCLPPIRGNVDYDALDQIDISDLVYTVDYMFNGGPAPICEDEADVNGEGGIDISDLVHLVDYMFNGGPPPVACP